MSWMQLGVGGRRGVARGAALTLAASAALALSACGGNAANATGAAGGGTQVTAQLMDTGCQIGTATIKGPAVTFVAQNMGRTVNEFYVYQADGRTMVAEVEYIDPGATKTLSVNLPAGTYMYGCKPGMQDANLRTAPFTVN